MWRNRFLNTQGQDGSTKGVHVAPTVAVSGAGDRQVGYQFVVGGWAFSLLGHWELVGGKGRVWVAPVTQQ